MHDPNDYKPKSKYIKQVEAIFEEALQKLKEKAN